MSVQLQPDVCVPSSSAPLVSAVVVNWNGGDMLFESLESLFGQSYGRIEVILVDNASTDGSGDEAVRRFGSRLHVIWNVENTGFAFANNQGIAQARGEWIFLLNNDAIADREAIRELVDFGASRREVGMLACRVLQKDAPDHFDSVGLLFYPDGVARSRGWAERDEGQYDRAEEILAPNACAAMYRRAMLEEVGVFDDAYFMYLEEMDLAVRGQLSGWRCWYVPSARAWHKKSATAGNSSSKKAYFVERNRVWNAVKLLPRGMLVRSPLSTLRRYVVQGYAAARGRGLSAEFVGQHSFGQVAGVMLRAYGAAALRLPEMMAKRREIQGRRRLSVGEWNQLLRRHELSVVELAMKA
ncbi:MAG: glycosyltransferase family 2 protein [Deltaproteobacteria bacterium]|nr:glycosyltransferase family 2 protein [Deltaproteobacteria bacterium]